MSGRLAGKTVIVTGAANGIGRVIAQCVRAEGGNAVAVDVNPESGDRDEDVQRLDVRDSEGWSALVQRTIAARGRIDGLVNNAGVNVKYEPLSMPDDEWDRCMDVNLRGAWNGARAVLPGMVAAGGGAIVNIASVHAHQIIPGSFPYPVAKHGLIGLTRSLGVEFAGSAVRVNAISPGYVDTRLCQDWWNSEPDPVAARRATEALIPAGRIGRPEEIGMTAVFLLSDEATYINATTIEVDGGRLAIYHD